MDEQARRQLIEHHHRHVEERKYIYECEQKARDAPNQYGFIGVDETDPIRLPQLRPLPKVRFVCGCARRQRPSAHLAPHRVPHRTSQALSLVRRLRSEWRAR